MVDRLAIYGNIASGKTTAANILVDSERFTRLAFARGVREACVSMLDGGKFRDKPFSVEEIDENKPVFRTLLQWVGTNLVRDYLESDDYWVRQLTSKLYFTPHPVVVDDMRFVNEAQALIDAGFSFIRVRCPDDVRRRRYLEANGYSGVDADAMWTNAIAHPSELQFDAIDALLQDQCPERFKVLFNDSSQMNLRHGLQQTMGALYQPIPKESVYV